MLLNILCNKKGFLLCKSVKWGLCLCFFRNVIVCMFVKENFRVWNSKYIILAVPLSHTIIFIAFVMTA